MLPFTVCAFLTQINLLLCSWHLLLRTRARLDRFSLLRHLDLQLHLSRLVARVRARRQRHAVAADVVDGSTPLPATAAAVLPSVQTGLQAAAARAKTAVRQRRRRRRKDGRLGKQEGEGEGEDTEGRQRPTAMQ